MHVGKNISPSKGLELAENKSFSGELGFKPFMDFIFFICLGMGFKAFGGFILTGSKGLGLAENKSLSIVLGFQTFMDFIIFSYAEAWVSKPWGTLFFSYA